MSSVLLTKLICRRIFFLFVSARLSWHFFLNVVSVLFVCVCCYSVNFFFPFVAYGPYFIPWLVSFVMCVIATLSSCHVNVQVLNRPDLLSVPRLYRLLTLCRLSSKYVEGLCSAY